MLKKLLAYHKKQIKIYHDFIREPALKQSHAWARRQLQKHEAFVVFLKRLSTEQVK